MSLLPPDTIQVKRKRGIDDGPVDFLRVDETNKRFLSGSSTWIYQRKQAPDNERPDHIVPFSPPVIKATKESDGARPVRAAKSIRRSIAPPAGTDDAGAPLAAPAPAVLSDTPEDQVRRFHLSRLALSQPATATTTTTTPSKKRGAPVVFVERVAKKLRESPEPAERFKDVSATPDSLAVRPSTPTSPDRMAPTAAQHLGQPKYKRPGTKAPKTDASAPPKPILPPSLLDRQGIDMDELARDMEAYTLSQITKTLNLMDHSSAKSGAGAGASPGSSSRSSRFKPKAPAKRFAERYPDYVAERERAKAAATHQADVKMADHGDMSDEEDYVMETYERVPASRLRDQAVPPHRVGLLVFDTEPDQTDFFFGNEDESDDEFLEDDEDENAENYYTADYPDEDLDWDDEFGHNPYRFAIGDDTSRAPFDEDRISKPDVWDE